jgi:hypothetical protein
MKKRYTETEIAAWTVAWLESQRWDVYQEVRPHYGGKVADIIAVRGPVHWIIETKTSLGLSVLDQAWRWSSYAHMRAVAIPLRRDKHRRLISSAKELAYRIARDYGIGIIRVDEEIINCSYDPGGFDKSPRMLHYLKDTLTPEHKTFCSAGTNEGGYYSEFRRTEIMVKRFIAENPGATMRQIVDGVEHHYANNRSARACLRLWIERGVIEGIRSERDGRSFRYYKE